MCGAEHRRDEPPSLLRSSGAQDGVVCFARAVGAEGAPRAVVKAPLCKGFAVFGDGEVVKQPAEAFGDVAPVVVSAQRRVVHEFEEVVCSGGGCRYRFDCHAVDEEAELCAVDDPAEVVPLPVAHNSFVCRDSAAAVAVADAHVEDAGLVCTGFIAVYRKLDMSMVLLGVGHTEDSHGSGASRADVPAYFKGVEVCAHALECWW